MANVLMVIFSLIIIGVCIAIIRITQIIKEMERDAKYGRIDKGTRKQSKI